MVRLRSPIVLEMLFVDRFEFEDERSRVKGESG